MEEINPLAYCFKVKIGRERFKSYCSFFDITGAKAVKDVAREFRERGYQI